MTKPSDCANLMEMTELPAGPHEHQSQATASAMALVCCGNEGISVRESLESLIRHAGWKPQTLESAGKCRGKVMDKMNACSLPAPVVMAAGLRNAVTPRR